MNTELRESIKVTREELTLLRFAFDLETERMQVEAVNKKYDVNNELINSEPVRLIFRNERYKKARDFCLAVNANTPERILNMLLRKLEIDRKLSDNTLCESLPEGVLPHRGIKK